MSLEDLFGPQPDEPERPASGREPRPPREPRTPRESRPARPPREPRERREPGGGGSRTTLILGIVAGVLTIVVAATLGFALTRPSDSASDTAATTVTPTDENSHGATGASSPSPVSSTPASTPAADGTLSLTADGFTLRGTSGTPFVHTWDAPAEPAIAALTAAFGSAPTKSVKEGNSHVYAYTVYSWPGFSFYDVLLGEGNKPRAEVDSPTFVSFTSNEPAGVEVTAEFGLSIGMTVAEVKALKPDSGGDTTPPLFWFQRGRSNFYSDGVRAYSAQVTTDGQRVTEIAYRVITSGL